jgi:hypothetical protein
MNWKIYSAYNSDEIGGKQKNQNSRRRRDEYANIDPTRDKSKDKKRKFQNNRAAKRGEYDERS